MINKQNDKKPIYEMESWWNGKLMKYHIDERHNWWNGKPIYLQLAKLVNSENNKFMKYHVGETPSW